MKKELKWQKRSVYIATSVGTAERESHVKGDLFLFDDLNEFGEDVWNLSHLGTGFRVCLLQASLANSKKIADDFLSCGDWSFTSPVPTAKLRASVKKIANKHKEYLSVRIGRKTAINAEAKKFALNAAKLNGKVV